MDQAPGGIPIRGHTRNKSAAKASRPRSSTKGPLDAGDDNPLASPTSILSHAKRLSGSTSQNASPRTSLSQTRSPIRVEAPRTQTPTIGRDFSFLLKPEIYHQISPLTIPAPFRDPARQPAADTPIPTLLAKGHFRAAAIAAAQELTGTSTTRPPVAPTDHARIFDLLYVRLSCLCLIDAVPLAAQEAKALEDLNSAFYADPDPDPDDAGTAGTTTRHLAPWPLRTLVVRLQTIGFGDPRRAVMSYYELTREAREGAARAAAARDHSAAETWKRRLADLGVRVAGALIEMDDLAGAAAHLASLAEAKKGSGSSGGGCDGLAMSRALLWLHLGDVDAARRCAGGDGGLGTRVVDALADMADGEYGAALGKWEKLREEMDENGVRDEMIGVNLALCLLYTGRMPEGRDVLEGLVSAGHSSHTLLFNLTTMYELCSDRAKSLKMRLVERVADMEPSPGGGWEKTNADFKL
ncbi:putative tetratricopeptide repeat protein 15 protein [Rosellinia necatrix]|uniref:Putative tetratricopeptide repeat protein 15 protein n=1 Tax=Rosellinia necatrix TaxID=77044 RepID=A0A1S8A7H0_ROSNE|nr:putative tetratricopeptide repeat protein 15 protein [Rosellinia necatrix]